MKDVEFHVESGQRGVKIHKSWEDASGDAVERAASGNTDVVIDVVIWSRSGAKLFGGDSAAEMYDEDPDASVFDRITVSANSTGRIP